MVLQIALEDTSCCTGPPSSSPSPGSSSSSWAGRTCSIHVQFIQNQRFVVAKATDDILSHLKCRGPSEGGIMYAHSSWLRFPSVGGKGTTTKEYQIWNLPKPFIFTFRSCKEHVPNQFATNLMHRLKELSHNSETGLKLCCWKYLS